MLYIKRKEGESIIIDDDIEVKILDIKGKTATLGITYPKSSRVLRREVYDRILEENQAAASSSKLLVKEK